MDLRYNPATEEWGIAEENPQMTIEFADEESLEEFKTFCQSEDFRNAIKAWRLKEGR